MVFSSKTVLAPRMISTFSKSMFSRLTAEDDCGGERERHGEGDPVCGAGPEVNVCQGGVEDDQYHVHPVADQRLLRHQTLPRTREENTDRKAFATVVCLEVHPQDDYSWRIVAEQRSGREVHPRGEG